MIKYTKQEEQEVRELLKELGKVEDSSSSKAKSIRNKLRDKYGYYISKFKGHSSPESARTPAGLDRLISNGYIYVIERNGNTVELKNKKNTLPNKMVCTKDSSVISFPPIVDNQSEILVLGTAPGADSLAKKEYYAKKENLFWKVISELFNQGHQFPTYKEKVTCLKNNHIAVWDTLASCERDGSSDSSIKDETRNDINEFLKQHPNIRKVVFNGKKPAKYYKPAIPFVIALSTSPANRQYSDEERIESWRKVLT